jgi:hypothetical protein
MQLIGAVLKGTRMKCMKWIPLLPLVLLLSIPSVPAEGAARKADARTFLGMAETGLSQAVRAAQASAGRLDRARPEQRPFWSALDKMGPALQRVRQGMAARDSSFFRALEDGSADLAELKVVWARSGAPDPAVSGALRVLSSSYELLRTGYGREAVRHRMGFGLMPAERERFLRIQRTQERLVQVLRDLEERARRRGDEAMKAELGRMAVDAWRVASAQLTLNAYLNALILADDQRGEWTANAQYAGAEDRPEWQEAGTVVEELYVEADIGQVFMVDLGDVNEPEAPAASSNPSVPSAGVTALAPSSALSFLDEPTDVPEELAEAVEAYEPSPVMAMDGTDDVDPEAEEEALAKEEVVADENGAPAEETSDLTIYEDIEDPDAQVSEDPETAVVDESEVEVEDLPIEKVEDPTAAPAPKPENATVAPKPEEKKETAKADKPAPQPAPTPAPKSSGKTSKKKSAKPPA